jgi:hypothetical protein
MVSSGLLRRVALVRTDVSEEPGASFIRVTKIGELGTTQLVLFLVLTRAIRPNNQEDTILHSHRRENLKSYIYVLVIINVFYCNLFPQAPWAKNSCRTSGDYEESK